MIILRDKKYLHLQNYVYKHKNININKMSSSTKIIDQSFQFSSCYDSDISRQIQELFTKAQILSDQYGPILSSYDTSNILSDSQRIDGSQTRNQESTLTELELLNSYSSTEILDNFLGENAFNLLSSGEKDTSKYQSKSQQQQKFEPISSESQSITQIEIQMFEQGEHLANINLQQSSQSYQNSNDSLNININNIEANAKVPILRKLNQQAHEDQKQNLNNRLSSRIDSEYLSTSHNESLLQLVENDNYYIQPENCNVNKNSFKKKVIDYKNQIGQKILVLYDIQQRLGKKNAQYLKNLNQLGEIYVKAKQFPQSLKCFNFVIETYQKQLYIKDQNYFIAYSNKAFNECLEQNIEISLKDQLNNIQLWKQNKNPTQKEEYANLLNNAGVYYFKLKKFTQAKSYYEQSMQIRVKLQKKNCSELTIGFTNLMEVSYELSQLDKAEQYLNKASQFLDQIEQKDTFAQANFYVKKGKFYLQKKVDYLQAMKTLQNGYDIYQRVFKNQNHPKLIQINFEIGLQYLMLKNKQIAGLQFQKCLLKTKQIYKQDSKGQKDLLQKINQVQQKVYQT